MSTEHPPETYTDFEKLFNKLQGKMGIIGLEGRSPIHVQEEKPTQDVQKGDLWYKPSTEEVKVYTGKKWKELLERGIIGLEGLSGEDGKDGKSVKGERGVSGKDGTDGLNAPMIDVQPIAEKEVKLHEKKFDHTLIDPFLVGSKKLDEAGMSDGMFLRLKGDKLIYSEIRDVAQRQISGGGTSLPARTGNGGKVLKVRSDLGLEWAAAGSGSGITRTILSVAVNTNAAAAADTDYTYLCSSTMTLTLPTAVSNTNLYSCKNVGVGTLTIAFTAGQNADGSATLSLPTRYTSVDLISDGSNWAIT